MIAFLAARFGLQAWMIELILAVGLVVAGVGYAQHLEHKGVVEQQTADKAHELQEEQETAARVAVAEHSHDQELSDLNAYRAAHPDVVRLCEPTSVRAPSAVARSSSPTPGPVQPMPSGDSGSGAGQAGPDVFPLLDALAARADAVSAQLRARQSIEP